MQRLPVANLAPIVEVTTEARSRDPQETPILLVPEYDTALKIQALRTDIDSAADQAADRALQLLRTETTKLTRVRRDERLLYLSLALNLLLLVVTLAICFTGASRADVAIQANRLDRLEQLYLKLIPAR